MLVSPGCQKGKTVGQNIKALKSTLSIHIPQRDQQSMDMCVYANAGRKRSRGKEKKEEKKVSVICLITVCLGENLH